MQIDISYHGSLSILPDDAILKVMNNTLKALNAWLRAESLDKASGMLKIRKGGALKRRLLTYKKNNSSLKLWIGYSPIGVHSWGDARETSTGVSAAGKSFKGAFISNMGGSEPMVWRRSDLSKSRSTIERVNMPIGEQMNDVIEMIALEVPDKFNELLEVELMRFIG